MKVSTVQWLSGYDRTVMRSSYVAELSPSVSDEEVLRQANARNAVLLTYRQGLR